MIRLTGSSGEIIVRGKDCDAYPNLTKYSWMHFKKYGKFAAATVIDDSFIMDKSPLTSAAQRLAQLRPGQISWTDNLQHLLVADGLNFTKIKLKLALVLMHGCYCQL